MSRNNSFDDESDWAGTGVEEFSQPHWQIVGISCVTWSKPLSRPQQLTAFLDEQHETSLFNDLAEQQQLSFDLDSTEH
jgi:hypothetical protein